MNPSLALYKKIEKKKKSIQNESSKIIGTPIQGIDMLLGNLNLRRQ
jgi:hypothetical protein